MTQLTPSRNQRHRIRAIAEEAGLTAAALAAEIDLPESVLESLFADERMMPGSQLLQRLVMYFWQQPATMLSVDADGPSLWELIGRPERAGEPFTVTVCGAGNLGHVFAGLLSARPDVTVNVLVSSPQRATALQTTIANHGGIRVCAPNGDVIGQPALVTADSAAAVADAQLVLICVPTHIQTDILEKVVPHLGPDAIIGAVPAAGGFHWLIQQALTRHRKRATYFGVVAIPWMCKVQTQGQTVKVLGAKQANGQVTLTPGQAGPVCDLLAALSGAPMFDMGNFLQITLNPGNQLLHPGIMYALFRDWHGEPLPWAESPLLYEGLSDEAADILEALSQELQAIKAALEAADPDLSLELVLPLQWSIMAGYGDVIADTSTLASTIRTNPAYAGIRTPMREVHGGRIPELNSRFFHEDIPFGLVVLRSLAQMAGVATPQLDAVLGWSQGLMGKSYLVDGAMTGPDMPDSGSPLHFGLQSLRDVVRTSAPADLTFAPA